MPGTNELRFASSIQVLQDVGGEAEAIEEINYTNLQHDGNADYRSWGGRFSLPSYDDDAVCYWENNIVDQTSATTVSAGACFTTAGVTDGTAPPTVNVIAVEYVSALGSPGDVVVTIGATEFASIGVGEGVVIPIYEGIGIANVKLHCAGYDGDNKPTVNVMIAGQNA